MCVCCCVPYLTFNPRQHDTVSRKQEQFIDETAPPLPRKQTSQHPHQHLHQHQHRHTNTNTNNLHPLTPDRCSDLIKPAGRATRLWTAAARRRSTWPAHPTERRPHHQRPGRATTRDRRSDRAARCTAVRPTCVTGPGTRAEGVTFRPRGAGGTSWRETRGKGAGLRLTWEAGWGAGRKGFGTRRRPRAGRGAHDSPRSL